MFAEAEAHARRSLELHPGGDQPGDRSSAAVSHLNLGASLIWQNDLSESPDATRLTEAVEHYALAMQLLEQTPGKEAARIRAITQVNVCDALIQSRSLERALETCTAVTKRPASCRRSSSAVVALA